MTTVTESRTVVEQAPEPQNEPVKKRKRKERRESATPTAEAPAEGGSIEVPNLVGADHQLAQDTLQSVGLYLIAEEDCTGQDRILIWDRNWTVVEQDPPPGTLVSEDTTVTLCSKKDGE